MQTATERKGRSQRSQKLKVVCLVARVRSGVWPADKDLSVCRRPPEERDKQIGGHINSIIPVIHGSTHPHTQTVAAMKRTLKFVCQEAKRKPQARLGCVGPLDDP